MDRQHAIHEQKAPSTCKKIMFAKSQWNGTYSWGLVVAGGSTVLLDCVHNIWFEEHFCGHGAKHPLATELQWTVLSYMQWLQEKRRSLKHRWLLVLAIWKKIRTPPKSNRKLSCQSLPFHHLSVSFLSLAWKRCLHSNLHCFVMSN